MSGFVRVGEAGKPGSDEYVVMVAMVAGSWSMVPQSPNARGFWVRKFVNDVGWGLRACTKPFNGAGARQNVSGTKRSPSCVSKQRITDS